MKPSFLPIGARANVRSYVVLSAYDEKSDSLRWVKYSSSKGKNQTTRLRIVATPHFDGTCHEPDKKPQRAFLSGPYRRVFGSSLAGHSSAHHPTAWCSLVGAGAHDHNAAGESAAPGAGKSQLASHQSPPTCHVQQAHKRHGHVGERCGPKNPAGMVMIARE